MNSFKKTMALLLACGMLASCGSQQNDSLASSTTSQGQSVEQMSTEPTEQPKTALVQAENTMPMPEQGKSALTGRDTQITNQRPVAVMMYNQKAAWPQWGTGDADLLIEANTEGQNTWLMAVYDGAEAVSKAGPVGQARDLFLQLVMPIEAIPMFIGSDVYASNLLNYYSYQPLDGIYAGTGAYDLDSERAKIYPEQYSWYAHKDLIANALGKYGQTTEGQPHSFFAFAQGSTPQNTQGYELDITYGSERTARLVYETTDQRYYLMDGDANQTDANKAEDSQVRFSNVILLMASSGYKDNGVTREYDLSGGQGLYLSAGGCQVISWEKGNAEQPLQLFDQNGTMLKVEPGRTYLGVYGGFEGQSLRLLDASGVEQSLPQAPQPLATPQPTAEPQAEVNSEAAPTE